MRNLVSLLGASGRISNSVVAIAAANKLARIAWAVLSSGQGDHAPVNFAAA